MAISVVDLFCGVGGMTHGFKLEDFNVVAGVDIDASCKYPYETNNAGAVFHQLDILNTSSEIIQDLFPDDDMKILIGCAPCQPYSSNSRAKRRKDDKWKLVPRFAEIIAEIQPTIVSMENVPDLVNSKKGEIFNNFIETLEKNNYKVWHDVVYAPNYGIPQARKRLVLLASKLGKIDLVKGTYNIENYPTVRSVIGDLPAIKAGDTHKNDRLHRSCKLAKINQLRMKQSIPGGTWHDWDEELVAPCHRKSSGSTYTSVYGRMEWDKPAPTITTQAYSFGSGRFGHPSQHRALSLREMALIQTFPPNYDFVSPDESIVIKRVGTLIGNAVPVVLGQRIAQSIERHLNKHGFTQ